MGKKFFHKVKIVLSSGFGVFFVFVILLVIAYCSICLPRADLSATNQGQNAMYALELRYPMYAAEGFGAELQVMRDTFQLTN